MFLSRTLPMILVFVMGIIGFSLYFIPHPAARQFENTLSQWSIAIGSFAIFLAITSLIRRYINNIKRGKDVFYSIVALVALFGMAGLGLFAGIDEKSLFQKIFINVNVPLDATMFSLLAFYVTSAAYRAFRARNVEATLLLVTAVVVILGISTIGDTQVWLRKTAEWIMNVPNLAQKRGILIGVGLGVIATSVKIILGIERNWMGG
ncbi:MAG: hypothetical protein DRQ10_03075 [Candidatus Hydrothermota bacterium]|nr:MAG: hypothetical protein DRQ10_03075 [Candidatus Hydrothermae bacterium]